VLIAAGCLNRLAVGYVVVASLNVVHCLIGSHFTRITDNVFFCYYCQFINMYNFCLNVTVVIEHIVLLTAARALISGSYVYLRLFFCLCLSLDLSLFVT